MTLLLFIIIPRLDLARASKARFNITDYPVAPHSTACSLLHEQITMALVSYVHLASSVWKQNDDKWIFPKHQIKCKRFIQFCQNYIMQLSLINYIVHDCLQSNYSTHKFYLDLRNSIIGYIKIILKNNLF